jgi:hypothetical protein
LDIGCVIFCKYLISLALPREVREFSKLNGLPKGVGESCLTDLQEVSERPPKPSSTTGEKPDLLVDAGDLPATARDVRDLLAESGCLFDRGVPVKVVSSPDGGPLTAFRLNGRIPPMAYLATIFLLSCIPTRNFNNNAKEVSP